MATPLRFVALLLIIIAAVFTTLAASLHLELRRVTPKAGAGAGLSMTSVGGRGATATVPVRSSTSTWWYVAEYRLGNPPQVAQALVDVGSDLVWTQARTCNRRSSCFQQDLPVYDASQSRTALNVPCTSRTLCAAQRVSRCISQASVCPISSSYDAVGEFTGYLRVGELVGDLGTDVFIFGGEEANITFGRVSDIHSDPGSWNLAGASGVMGLGRGPLSLVSQLGATKFSYCLTSLFFSGNATSQGHLFVGSSAGLRGGGAPATSVPFVANPTEEPYSSFYYLPLVGISLGSTRLDIPASAFEVRRASPGVSTGGTVIDLSTQFTFLVDVAFNALGQELERQLGNRLLPLEDHVGFSYCVDSLDFGFRGIPSLVLHFGRGGGEEDLVLPAANYWSPVLYSGQEMACMLILSSSAITELPMNETTVIGDYMQQDINVFYDLGRGVVSFEPTDCSSL